MDIKQAFGDESDKEYNSSPNKNDRSILKRLREEKLLCAPRKIIDHEMITLEKNLSRLLTEPSKSKRKLDLNVVNNLDHIDEESTINALQK